MNKLNLFILFLLLGACFACAPKVEEQKEEVTEQKTAEKEAVVEQKQVEEVKVPLPSGPKAVLLQTLVGAHHLNVISAATGANTLIDVYKNKGEWTAEASSLEMGQREAFDWELKPGDIDLLNTLRLVVKEDLSIELVAGEKQFFTVPFKADGMNFSLKTAPKEFISVIPKELTESTTFIEGNLYLYAEDMMTDLELLDVLDIEADALLLYYDKDMKKLVLYVFFGTCCDTAEYTFELS